MSGKHRMVSDPVRNPHAQDNGRKTTARRAAGAMMFPASIAVAFAGFSAAVLVSHTDSDQAIGQPQPQAQAYVAPQPQSVSQQGTIVAVSDSSITTRSADGDIQTYRITPSTTAVTQSGGQSFTSTAPFDVNDEVAVHATVTGDSATATAVADQAVIGEHGRPMDSL